MNLSSVMKKKFVIALSAVVLVFAGIDILFGKAMESFMASSKGGDTQNLHYIVNDFQDSVAVFGSSRANHHYDVSILSENLGVPVYNCGKDGNGIILAYIFLNNMIEKGKAPSLVIYDFFPDFDIYDRDDRQRAINYVSPYFRNPAMKEVIKDIAPEEYLKMNLSTYRYNSKFVQIISDRFMPRQFNKRGYKPLEGTITIEPSEKKVASAEIDSVKVRYMKKFVNLCKKNDIKLIFVTSPYFKKLKTPENERKLFNKYVGGDYHLIDFRNNEDFTGRKDLFCDPSHLNRKGAEIFTRQLADSVKVAMSERVDAESTALN